MDRMISNAFCTAQSEREGSSQTFDDQALTSQSSGSVLREQRCEKIDEATLTGPLYSRAAATSQPRKSIGEQDREEPE